MCQYATYLGGLFSWVVWLVVLCGTAVPTRGQSAQTGPEPLQLHFALTRSSFLGVNEDDAKVALNFLAVEMARECGYPSTTEVSTFDDLDALVKEARLGTFNFILIDTWDYLGCESMTNMPVEFLLAEQGALMDSYLLLVRPDSGIHGFSDLKGKEVLVLDRSASNSGRHWLATELLAQGQGASSSSFCHIEYVEKLSKTILPVFFGKKDACVVDRSGLRLMTELNPQIGRELTVVAESEPLLDSIGLVRKGVWKDPQIRQDMINGILHLSDYEVGRQILTLFKLDEMVPFFHGSLDSMRALRARYDLLKGQQSIPVSEGR